MVKLKLDNLLIIYLSLEMETFPYAKKTDSIFVRNAGCCIATTQKRM